MHNLIVDLFTRIFDTFFIVFQYIIERTELLNFVTSVIFISLILIFIVVPMRRGSIGGGLLFRIRGSDGARYNKSKDGD